MEELGKVLAILSGHTGYERARHAGNPWCRAVRGGTRQSMASSRIRAPRASLGLHMDSLRVAYDVGSLAGLRTGVGHAAASMRDSLRTIDDLELLEYIVSFRSTPPPGDAAPAPARAAGTPAVGRGRPPPYSTGCSAGPTSSTAPTTSCRRAAPRRWSPSTTAGSCAIPPVPGPTSTAPAGCCGGPSAGVRPFTPAPRRRLQSSPICFPDARSRRSRLPRCRCPNAVTEPTDPGARRPPVHRRDRNARTSQEPGQSWSRRSARSSTRPMRSSSCWPAPTVTTARRSTRPSTSSTRCREHGVS